MRDRDEAASASIFSRGMERLASAQARLAAAPLDQAAVAALRRLVMDASSALLMLDRLGDRDMEPDRFRREAARLDLALPGGLVERLPAAARIGALELATLCGALAARLQEEAGGDMAGTAGNAESRDGGRAARGLVW
ncbi:hypothetical protein K9U40_10025 [Xanthobacter autotrophicus]|uniref:hypothetical protein n=1 Tax=Xanthobacter TaxID=279 RepID=UPI0024AC7625|nr:hypothetical protein [Xanthobacter autotrophicus]MDI4664661.1 hypothetical protein [Xanthobacter autotrophicus]